VPLMLTLNTRLLAAVKNVSAKCSRTVWFGKDRAQARW
jgi:hypothetical protein